MGNCFTHGSVRSCGISLCDSKDSHCIDSIWSYACTSFRVKIGIRCSVFVYILSLNSYSVLGTWFCWLQCLWRYQLMELKMSQNYAVFRICHAFNFYMFSEKIQKIHQFRWFWWFLYKPLRVMILYTLKNKSIKSSDQQDYSCK